MAEAKHAWRPTVRSGQPVLRCENAGCPIVWWPDRREPKSKCKGTPVDPTPFVRALMIGGASLGVDVPELEEDK